MPKTIKDTHASFIRAVENHFESFRNASNENRVISRKEILEVVDATDVEFPNWLTVESAYRHSRGNYYLPTADGSFNPANGSSQSNTVSVAVNDNTDDSDNPAVSTFENTALVQKPTTKVVKSSGQSVSATGGVLDTLGSEETYIPDVNPNYMKFGHWRDVHRIVNSRMFYPVFITGPSGNGKTTMVEQVCADLGREYFRANITAETDEGDLIGNFRLRNGETVFEYGPVLHAMLRGGVLLLDEVDLATPKIMCLQPVLEGRAIFVKKINRWIRPAPGFTVFATANTKGKGSDDGQFIGTNVMNEAFLDRFPMTLEQPYPTPAMEKKILCTYILNSTDAEKHSDIDPDLVDYVNHLTAWAEHIRKSYNDGACAEVISTRRLLNILQHNLIFRTNKQDFRRKSIEVCVSRFDEETKTSFIDFYNKIDPREYNSDGTVKVVSPEEAKKSNEKMNYETSVPFA